MNIGRTDIAIRLAEERTRIGYSQASFARALDISRESVRLYENGASGLNAEILAKAASLGIDVQYVLVGVRSVNLKEAEAAAAPAVSIGGGNTNVIGMVHSGATVNQIHTQRHVAKTIVDVKAGDGHISHEQASVLLRLTDEIYELERKLKKDPKTMRAIRGALNAHCGVPQYRLIRAEDYSKAEKYLRQWIGRLNALATAPVKDGDAWRKRKYAYIKINSKDDPAVVDAYIARNFKATSLAELANDELERVYRYVAGRKNKK